MCVLFFILFFDSVVCVWESFFFLFLFVSLVFFFSLFLCRINNIDRFERMNVLVIFSNSIRPINFPPIFISYDLIVVFLFRYKFTSDSNWNRILFRLCERKLCALLGHLNISKPYYVSSNLLSNLYGLYVCVCLLLFLMLFFFSFALLPHDFSLSNISHTTFLHRSRLTSFLLVTLFIVRYIIRYH